MPTGLFALALGAFGIGLTEFGIVGLLPQIVAEFNISEQVAGYLVSGYAISVAVGAIALTSIMIRMERRLTLLLLTALFIVGNLISAMSTSYETLLFGRIVAALCHGAFFSVGAVVASDMVAGDKKGAAISLMFAGLTVSNIVGVPLGTFVGLELGWRTTFWALSIIGLVTIVGIKTLVPPMPAHKDTNLGREFAVFNRPQVWVSALLSVLSFGGVIGGFTYIAFTLTQVSGFATQTVPWLLVLFGVGTFIGNIYGGKAADKSLNKSLGAILLLLTLVMASFAMFAQSQIMTVILMLLMGTVGLATAPGLQLRMMKYASDAPTVASGTNIAAFNIGNALGAWLGGMALDKGFGFVSPLWVGAALSLAALAVVILGSVNGGLKTSRVQG
ncbi:MULTISPECIES: MFS transporter [Cedecea]|uniref:MFS transporter n=1 Tax=Cedecea davisae TaxID=158484 RepID=A0ABS6DJ48_9ENTR|nr:MULTISPECIES: MFS transporter [Cedecea]MBU4683192.1 MFS transporter [Cedecea davisae]MBU4686656.1 MFS transporter [Cedecea davisae]QIX96979.1 MFS transporter [Cedecea sp. FDAARGOS_727]